MTNRFLFKWLALLFGIGSAFILVLLVELGLRLNKSHGWIPQFNWNTPPLKLSKEMAERLNSSKYYYLYNLPNYHDPGKRYPPVNYITTPSSPWNTSGGLIPGTYRETATDKTTNEVRYSFEYVIDSHGRRQVSADNTPKNLSEYLLFYGCSFTFGKGLDAHETLPAFAQRELRKFHAYNMGVPGSSPSGILASLMDDTDIRNQGIIEAQGISLYIYIDDHISRVLGTANWLAHLFEHQNHPFFELQNDQPQLRGSFTQRGLVNSALRLFGNSGISHYFSLDYPRLNSERARLFAVLIENMAAKMRQRFNLREFIVVVYPGEGRLFKDWYPYIKDPAIRFLDYGSIPIAKVLKNQQYIRGEGHPSALANRFLWDLISEDLKAFQDVQQI